MNRKSFSAIILGLVACALHATVVVDVATKLPLAKAPLFDSNGTVVGMTDEKGRVPKVRDDCYPLSVKYVGYASDEILNQGVDTLGMIPLSYDLQELTVSEKNKNPLHIVAFARVHGSTTYMTDTVTYVSEMLLDCDYKNNFMKINGLGNYMRCLKQSSYFHFSNDAGLDSVSNRYELSSPTCGLTIPQTRKIPSSLRSNGSIGKEVKEHGIYKRVWRREPNNYVLTEDFIGSLTTDHEFSPWIFKLFGISMDMIRDDVTYKFAMTDSKYASAEDLVFMSEYTSVMLKGKTWRKQYRSSTPIKADEYLEVYILDRQYMTEDECKNYKVTQEILDRIDSIVPPLSERDQRIKARVKALNN